MNNLFGVRILHKVDRGYNKGKEIRTEKKGGRDEGKHREKRGDMEGAKRKKKVRDAWRGKRGKGAHEKKDRRGGREKRNPELSKKR